MAPAPRRPCPRRKWNDALWVSAFNIVFRLLCIMSCGCMLVYSAMLHWQPAVAPFASLLFHLNKALSLWVVKWLFSHISVTGESAKTFGSMAVTSIHTSFLVIALASSPW